MWKTTLLIHRKCGKIPGFSTGNTHSFQLYPIDKKT